MRKRPTLLGGVLRLGAAAVVGALASREQLAEVDDRVRAAVARRSSEHLDLALPALTDLGSTYALAGMATALAIGGRRRLAHDVLGAGLLAWVVSQATKLVYRRRRPYDVDESVLLVRRPAGTSYPSGHPAVAAAVARVLLAEVRGPVRPLVLRIPRLVAFSRVYVGAHYPTDVIGGLLLGRGVGDLYLRRARRGIVRRRRRN